MKYTKLYSTFLHILMICSLVGYGRISAQDASDIAGDDPLNNMVKSAGSFNGNLSGTAGYCKGEDMHLTLDISGGKSPYEATLTRWGSAIDKDTSISGINGSPSIIQIRIAGSYVLKSLTDSGTPNADSATVSSVPVVLTRFPEPQAVLDGGTDTICEYTTANLDVTLTGNNPWRFSYRINGEAAVEVSNIQTSPITIPAVKAGTYTLFEINDSHCKGTVSGSAVITVTPAPLVAITGLAGAYVKDNDQLVPVAGDPPGGNFSGPGLFNSNGSWYFLPRYAPVGIQNIVYTYQEPGSCYGYDTIAVQIWDALAAIDFPDNRKRFCQNDHSFIITGKNLADSIGSFAISGGVALTDNHDNTATITPSLLGVHEYAVTYTYFAGATFTFTDTFEIRNLPDISVSQNANILTAKAIDAVYQWIDCIHGDAPIDGETSSAYLPDHDGEYAVIVTENGCIDTSTCYLVSSTGLVIHNTDRNITLYPNPNKGFLYINMDKVYPDIEVTIADLDGRIIQKENYKYVQLLKLTLKEPPGPYVLIVNTENLSKIFRVLKV